MENNNYQGLIIGSLVAVIFATIFFFLELSLENTQNYGLYTIMLSIFSSINIVKAINSKSKKDIILAIVFVVLCILTAVLHIMNLVK